MNNTKMWVIEQKYVRKQAEIWNLFGSLSGLEAQDSQAQQYCKVKQEGKAT